MLNFNGYKTVYKKQFVYKTVAVLHYLYIHFFFICFIFNVKYVENGDPRLFPSSSLVRGRGCFVGDVSRKYRSLCSLC